MRKTCEDLKSVLGTTNIRCNRLKEENQELRQLLVKSIGFHHECEGGFCSGLDSDIIQAELRRLEEKYDKE